MGPTRVPLVNERKSWAQRGASVLPANPWATLGLTCFGSKTIASHAELADNCYNTYFVFICEKAYSKVYEVRLYIHQLKSNSYLNI